MAAKPKLAPAVTSTSIDTATLSEQQRVLGSNGHIDYSAIDWYHLGNHDLASFFSKAQLALAIASCRPHSSLGIQQNCVQEVVTVVAPKLMGGTAARTPLGDLGFVAMDQVLQGAWHRCEPLGHDWLLRWRSGS